MLQKFMLKLQCPQSSRMHICGAFLVSSVCTIFQNQMHFVIKSCGENLTLFQSQVHQSKE